MDEVIRLYLDGKTTREVAGLVGKSKSRVAQIIKKSGVSRDKRVRQSVLLARAKTCPEMSKWFVSYLDGLLISDGSLARPSKNTPTSCYTHDSISFMWLSQISKTFVSQGLKCSVKPIRNRPGQYQARSFRYDKLFGQYTRWYSSDGEKHVPRDIDISSKDMLRNWVYGDGTRVKTTLRLCTDSFALRDTEFLLESLCQLGFDFRKVHMGKSKSGADKFRLSICKSGGLHEFLEYIGPPGVSDLSYKWDL